VVARAICRQISLVRRALPRCSCALGLEARSGLRTTSARVRFKIRPARDLSHGTATRLEYALAAQAPSRRLAEVLAGHCVYSISVAVL